tara:strand:+ start:88 stop:441 length:354 start_codon:yes stop_codon:yes gene_type:complete
MKNRLQRVSTEEGAAEILQRLVDSGKCTVENFDKPSNHWQENFDFASKHYPEIKHPVYKNLLREQNKTRDSTEVDSRSDSGVLPEHTPLLLPQEESVCANISEPSREEERLLSQRPF